MSKKTQQSAPINVLLPGIKFTSLPSSEEALSNATSKLNPISLGTKTLKYTTAATLDTDVETIAKRMGLSTDELIKWNPEFANGTIKKGTKIKLNLNSDLARALMHSVDELKKENKRRRIALQNYIDENKSALKLAAFMNGKELEDLSPGASLNTTYNLIRQDTNLREDLNSLEHENWKLHQSAAVKLANFDNHIKGNNSFGNSSITSKEELDLIRLYLQNPSSKNGKLFFLALSGNLTALNPKDNERYRNINNLAKKYLTEINGTQQILQQQFSKNIRDAINTAGKYGLAASTVAGGTMVAAPLLASPVGSWLAGQVPWMAGDYAINKGLDYIGQDDPNSWANNRYVRTIGSAAGMLGGNWVGSGIKGMANYGLKTGIDIASQLLGSSALLTTGAMMMPTVVNHGLDFMGDDDENSWANNPYLRSIVNIGSMVVGHAAADKLLGIGRSRLINYKNELVLKLQDPNISKEEATSVQLAIDKLSNVLNTNEQSFSNGLAGQNLRSGTSIKYDIKNLGTYIANKVLSRKPTAEVPNTSKSLLGNDTAGSFTNGTIFGSINNIPLLALDLGATYLDENYDTGIKENSLYMPLAATLSGKLMGKGYKKVQELKESAGGTSNGVLFAANILGNAVIPPNSPLYYSGSVPIRVASDKHLLFNSPVVKELRQLFPSIPNARFESIDILMPELLRLYENKILSENPGMDSKTLKAKSKAFRADMTEKLEKELSTLRELAILDYESLSPEEKQRYILSKKIASFVDRERNPDKVGGQVQMEGDRSYTAPFYEKSNTGFSQGEVVTIKDLSNTQEVLRALAASLVRRAGHGAYYDQVTPELSTNAKFNENSMAYSENGSMVPLFIKLQSGLYIINPEILGSSNRKAEWALGRSGNHIYLTNVGGYNRILALDSNGRFIELASDTPGYGNTSGTYKNPGFGQIVGGIGGKWLDWNSYKPASTNAREIKEGDKYYNTTAIVHREKPINIDVDIKKPFRENPTLFGIRTAFSKGLGYFVDGYYASDFVSDFKAAKNKQEQQINEAVTKKSSHYWHPFDGLVKSANAGLDTNIANNLFIRFNEAANSKNKSDRLQLTSGLNTKAFGNIDSIWKELTKYQVGNTYVFPQGMDMKSIQQAINIMETLPLNTRKLQLLQMLKNYVASNKLGGKLGIKQYGI